MRAKEKQVLVTMRQQATKAHAVRRLKTLAALLSCGYSRGVVVRLRGCGAAIRHTWLLLSEELCCVAVHDSFLSSLALELEHEDARIPDDETIGSIGSTCHGSLMSFPTHARPAGVGLCGPLGLWCILGIFGAAVSACVLRWRELLRKAKGPG